MQTEERLLGRETSRVARRPARRVEVSGLAAEVIAIRRGSERTKVLVGLHREECPHCMSGTRTVSTWSTLRGTTERISWCQHCFNAQCILARLSDEERDQFEHACAAIEERVHVRDCARHAVEYLQRLMGDS
jgi:hypothetical protein